MNTREVPEAAAASLCSQKTPPPRGTSRWREWCKCAGVAGTLVALQAGCPGAQVRQSPMEECRTEAVAAMELLSRPFTHPTYGEQIRVQLDLATPKVPTPDDEDGCVNGPCLRPGPITSVVLKGHGKLVPGTLLSGRVFGDGDPEHVDSWNFRWTEATLPSGDKHPVCIEGGFQGDKCPNSGLQICPEIPAYIMHRWDRPIIP